MSPPWYGTPMYPTTRSAAGGQQGRRGVGEGQAGRTGGRAGSWAAPWAAGRSCPPGAAQRPQRAQRTRGVGVVEAGVAGGRDDVVQLAGCTGQGGWGRVQTWGRGQAAWCGGAMPCRRPTPPAPPPSTFRAPHNRAAGLTRQAEVGHILKRAICVLDVHLVVLPRGVASTRRRQSRAVESKRSTTPAPPALQPHRPQATLTCTRTGTCTHTCARAKPSSPMHRR